MCCPGTKGVGDGSAKKKLLIRGVRGTTERTLVAVHASFGGLATASAPTDSISRVALLLPGIAVHVVPAELPEAGLVALGELQRVHPLRRLPEVEVRDEQAGRAA